MPILSTDNPSKIVQIYGLVANTSITLRTKKEVGIEGAPNEDHSESATIEGNARIKARFVHDRCRTDAAIADDTGLFIHALGGAPGVRAAIWGGDLTVEERRSYCLTQMEGKTDRRATFRTAVVIITSDGREYMFDGSVDGTLLERPRVDSQPGMPYSSLFVPDGGTRAFAEMSTEEENAISHRGIAFRKALQFLEQQR